MKVLITGAHGFMGRNLCAHLKAKGFDDLLLYHRQSDPAILDEYAASCDFVFHLAGVNRPKNQEQFAENHQVTQQLLQALKKAKKKAPVLLSSSTQAGLSNPYGMSKRRAEEMVQEYGQETGAEVYLFRLPGVFGKWGKPDYNSVVATFCHNIAHELPIRLDNPDAPLSLVYIDDLLETFTAILQGTYGEKDGLCEVKPVHQTTVGQLAYTIQSFRDSRQSLFLIDAGNPLMQKLYGTYLSYLPQNKFSYELRMLSDDRGSFAECLKSAAGGQVSVNITKPGMTKGGHWHHTKTEKIIVVSGTGIIRFQQLGKEDMVIYPVSGEHLEVVDIPPGYIHDVTNSGDSDMAMLIWSSQIFDPQHPDTYPALIDRQADHEEE